jgi:hypothetical protein
MYIGMHLWIHANTHWKLLWIRAHCIYEKSYLSLGIKFPQIVLILTFPMKIPSEIEWLSSVECRPKAWRCREAYRSVWFSTSQEHLTEFAMEISRGQEQTEETLVFTKLLPSIEAFLHLLSNSYAISRSLLSQIKNSLMWMPHTR